MLHCRHHTFWLYLLFVTLANVTSYFWTKYFVTPKYFFKVFYFLFMVTHSSLFFLFWGLMVFLPSRLEMCMWNYELILNANFISEVLFGPSPTLFLKKDYMYFSKLTFFRNTATNQGTLYGITGINFMRAIKKWTLRGILHPRALYDSSNSRKVSM